MRYMTKRSAELMGAEVVIAIFFPIFLVAALFSMFEAFGTRESFYAAVAAFTSGCIALGAIISYLIALYFGVGSGPGPNRGIPINKQTTPCDARG